MNALNDHLSAKAYYQHGFLASGENESQIWGRCAFCGKESKMYISKETKAWDCKSCGRSGGFQSFLNQMSAHCQENFTGLKAVALQKSRGISISTFKANGIGYNKLIDAFTISIFDNEQRNCIDVRRYINKKLFSTFSCKAGLFNAHSIKENETVWLCEGEWDGLAMLEVIAAVDKNESVVAVPGAGTFRPEWQLQFRDKIVYVVYDNDEAGNKGAIKVYNMLKSIARTLKFHRWDSGAAVGFDLRDLYLQTKDAEETRRTLLEDMEDLPQGVNLDDVLGTNREQNAFTGEGLSAEKVYEEYRKWLHIPDTSVIDVLYGTIIANRLQGDPLWLFLVAPPGFTKTEFLQSISGAPRIEAISTLSSHALISGINLSGGNDPSLIARLNEKILVIKDFTTILKINQTEREELFGILRDIYDGEITKIFGHMQRHYISRFGIIAGVTPAIEVVLEDEAALGERFMRFELKLPKSLDEQLDYLRRAVDNVAKEKEMREQLKALGTRCLNHTFDTEVIIDGNMHEKILHCALFTSILRGTVARDKYSKEVTHRPFREIATRLAKQFVKLLHGIGKFRGKELIDDSEYEILKTLAKSTVPRRSEDLIRKMIHAGVNRYFTIRELSEFSRLPNSTTLRVVENMHLLGVLKKNSANLLKHDWEFSDDFKQILSVSELYK